ncbi:MAG: NADH-quinone oxidoreductase subunit NuoK [Myxococcota bacterium]|jgi:NADH-quinone oxidoreductase subunit K|nr:NADH-quinone oxidoreductase subunit NuoK [Myxococcota bacterium]
MPGLLAYLVLGALLFGLGVYGVLSRRNAIGLLLGVELMMNAANINLVAYSRFSGTLDGQVFTLFTIALTVAEVAVGLAVVILLYRTRSRIDVDEADLLRG